MPILKMAQERRQGREHLSELGPCEQKNRLMAEFLIAIHELVEIQEQQTRAVIQGDPDFARFDILLHMARERKEDAKYACIAHVESHHCEDA